MLIPIRDINPHKRFPVVTLLLIAANVVVFFATADNLLAIGPEAAHQYGAVPCDVTGRCPDLSLALEREFSNRSPLLSILTSMFMHGDILHLAFNMLFLWVFGNNIEDRLGRVRFPIFYLLTGLAASFAHIVFATGSRVPTVGASGAISGVLGGYILLWPRATIVSLVPLGFFFFSVRTPAWVSLGLWFVLQLFGGAAGLGRSTGEGGGVAYLAHIGGFVAGLVLIKIFDAGRPPPEAVPRYVDGVGREPDW